MFKNKNQYLWRNSPCCLNYITEKIPINKVPRFQVGSIYHKDEVGKPKKVFNEFEKPDLLLHQFRRQILQASHPKYNTAAKKNKEVTEKQRNKFRAMSMTTASKLYQIPSKTQYKYDRNGFRGHIEGDYNVKDIENRIKSSKNNFSFGRRVDLSRPLNFFPGPGTYYLQKKQNDQKQVFTRTCHEFRKKNNQDVENPQVEKNSLHKWKQQAKKKQLK